MEQHNQGKISIQQGVKEGDHLVWGPVAGEKEYLYFSEAKEMMETITWQQAEEICGQKLTSSSAILIKSWQRMEGDQWHFLEERVLLLFTNQ